MGVGSHLVAERLMKYSENVYNNYCYECAVDSAYHTYPLMGYSVGEAG